MVDENISTKADILIYLQDKIEKSYIEDMKVFTIGDFLQSRLQIYHTVYDVFKGDRVDVSSSPRANDTQIETLTNIDSSSIDELSHAISTTMESFLEGEVNDEIIHKLKEEQIVVSRVTRDVIISGEVYTRDTTYNRPYYMVNYSEYDDDFFAVKTKWIARNVSREFLDEKFTALLNALREIEKIFEDEYALYVEFLINKEGKIIIGNVKRVKEEENQLTYMTDAEFIDTKAFAKCNYLDTNHIMSDRAYWNVTESIGINPRPLEYSVYRELITYRMWNEAVRKLGYEAVDDELMYKVGNKPYVSMNNCFEGLTPKGVDRLLSYRIQDYYEERLKKNRNLHKKITENIMLCSFDFSTDDRIKEMMEYGFSEVELQDVRKRLYDLTLNAIRKYDEYLDEDLKSTDKLIEMRHDIRKKTPKSETNIMKLYNYLQELFKVMKTNSSPQYVLHARYESIAYNFCFSLVKVGAFTKEEVDNFIDSIPTMHRQYDEDFNNYMKGRLSKDVFNKTYGHFRMMPYDIRSECYKRLDFDVEIEDNTEEVSKQASEETSGKQKEIKYLDNDRLQKALFKAGIDIKAKEFSTFLVNAIKNVDIFEFEFLKTVSLILDIIDVLGDVLGLAKEDMSYLDIDELLSYHSRDSYLQMINERRRMYHAYKCLVLPDVIMGIGDIDVIEQCFQLI